MSDANPPTLSVLSLVPEQDDSPGRDRETAYQLWAFTFSRTARKVAHALDLPERTVQRWAKDGCWAERYRRDIAQLSPDLHVATVGDLVLLGKESVALLRQVVNDESIDIKVRIQAAIAGLDRAGYSPLARSEPRLPAKPSLDPVDLAALTDEDLIGIPDSGDVIDQHR